MQQILKIVLNLERGRVSCNILEKKRKSTFLKMFNHPRIAFLYNLSYVEKKLDSVAIQNYSCINNRQYTKNTKKIESQSITISRINSQKEIYNRRLNGDAFENKQEILKKEIENVLKQRMSLRNAKKKMQEKGKIIIQDIRETKNKMKEKFEEVIERENIYTIPNLICITRIGLSPLLGYLIVSENFECALAFMVIAGISDWIDGWVARSYKSQCSKIGSFLDPMADKVLIGTLFLSLTYVCLIPVALTSLVIFRDIILITSGFVIRYRSLPPPKTLSRYFDASHATAQLAPTFISKVNTGIQLVLVGATLAAPILGYVDHTFLQIMWYITAASTLAAAGSYIFSKKTYKFFKDADYRKK